ncbi:succinate dehydrogenase cytochrome b560 subunit [Dichotomocladium elegans]|nr:succinate dehydrogenase cytochrome b560 subunit [Dichotomocladium elegans]
MLATRSMLKTIAQNPAARAAMFKNTAAAPMGVRHFNATRVSKEQSPAAESELLRQQRKVRPTSPHVTIYQPQLTWYMSGAHRITGTALGLGFYAGALAYLTAPALGYTFDTAAIISSVAAAPVALKVAAKTIVGFPFVFHCLNGIRHLVWDTTRFIDIKGVYKTGYIVLGSSLAGTLYLASL